MLRELYLTSIIVPSHHIQVSDCASQLNPGPFSTPSRSRDLCLISIQVPRFTSPVHPSWVSPQSRSLYLHLAFIQAYQIASKPHLSIISNAYMFQDVCLISLQVISQLENCISAPSQSHITPSSSQDVHLNSIQVPSQPHPGLEICVSSPPGSHIHISSLSQLNLTSIWVLIFASRLHPDNIQALSQLANCISAPS